MADPAALTSAVLRVNADDGHTTYVNGTQVSATTGANNAWQTLADHRHQAAARGGHERHRHRSRSTAAGAGSFIAVAELDGTRIVTDGTWKTLPGSTADAARRLEHAALRRLGVGGRHGHRRLRDRALEPERPDAARPDTSCASRASQGFSAGDSIRIDTGANEEDEGHRRPSARAGANGRGLTLTSR